MPVEFGWFHLRKNDSDPELELHDLKADFGTVINRSSKDFRYKLLTEAGNNFNVD